jgi:hypothetical protein
MLPIDLLQWQPRLQVSRKAEVTYVYDPIRRKHLVLQPEELVRQLLLRYMLDELAYPANRIRVEIGIEVNGLPKRCDIVVFDAEVQPWLLVECKSPKIPIRLETFEQAARYNLQLRAPYLAATNGLTTYCAQLHFDTEQFTHLNAFPAFPK